MTDLKHGPSPADLTGAAPTASRRAAPDPVEEVPDRTGDDRSLLRRIRSHLPDDFKAEAEGRGIDWVVFGVVALLAIGFVLWGFLGTDSLATTSTNALGALIGATGWAFVLTASLFVVFVLWLALGKFGSIPLGQDGEKPAFKTWSWISMMFAAGMGIGLMFYGVAEAALPLRVAAARHRRRQTPAAIQTAMATSLFHWTLHPWRCTPWSAWRWRTAPTAWDDAKLLSDIFTPLFGRKAVDGAGGKVINILAIFATLFGSAASLGLGAIQIGGGLEANGVISSPSRPVYVVIIAILTVCFVASAVSRHRARHPVAVEHEHGARDPAGAARLRRRPHRLHPEHDPVGPWATTSATSRTCRRARRRPGTPRSPPGSRAGRSSTGPGGSAGRFRRDVHRPDQPRPHDPAVRHRCAAGAERRVAAVVRDLRRRGDRAAAAGDRGGRDHVDGRGRSTALRASRRRRALQPDQHARDAVRADHGGHRPGDGAGRHLLRHRRRLGLDHHGVDLVVRRRGAAQAP